ncbi:MAG: signal peptide peptidase SppA, 36K type, protease IV [Parcubacteria group bacterium GW2011_GWC1_43_30]|nr:MAG: signal peptide peptidase SppA, 36K type, protease IV [Parcubacteria group bacterium GW2011_GWC1_43_30]
MRTIREEILLTLADAVIIIIFFFIGLWGYGMWHDEWSGYNASWNENVSDGVCNIAVASVSGGITTISGATTTEEEDSFITNADDVIALLRSAEADLNVLGVIINIDSLGGAPVASELIANALKNLSLPTVALIREFGTSGGYLAATGADTIIASPFSDVGSIGVTLSYLENWEKNAKEGLRFVSLSSGKYKDYGNPDKPLTAEERTLLERDLKIYHDQFVKEVSENRNLPIEDISKLADGSSMPGELALQNKLIDALGDQETARAWFAGELGISNEEVIFCE